MIKFVFVQPRKGEINNVFFKMGIIISFNLLKTAAKYPRNQPAAVFYRATYFHCSQQLGHSFSELLTNLHRFHHFVPFRHSCMDVLQRVTHEVLNSLKQTVSVYYIVAMLFTSYLISANDK